MIAARPRRGLEDEHVAAGDRTLDAVHGEVGKEMRLLVSAAGQIRKGLEVRFEGVVIGVGHVERKDVGARGGESPQGISEVPALRQVGAHDSADRAQAPAEEQHRLASRDRSERPRQDEEPAFRRRGVSGGGEVEVIGDRREVRRLDRGLLTRADGVIERVPDLLMVVGEILPQLQMGIVGDDGHAVGGEQVFQESPRLEAHPDEAHEPGVLEAGLEEEDDQPPRRSQRDRSSRRRLREGRLDRDLGQIGRHPVDRLERNAFAVHAHPEVRRSQVRDRVAETVRDVRVHDD